MEQASTTPSAPLIAVEVRVARALLSVSDKTGIVEFARGLAQLGIEIVSTGGTFRELTDAGVPVRSVSELTGFPEIMDGRVKTLHPKLYAGVLAVRDEPSHLQQAEEHEVEFVDLVCVNLYPFERTAAMRGVGEREVIENIDIGGPTMIRAAAKNYRYVAPVVSPESYDAVLAELRESDRRLAPATRQNLAAEAFAYTARYDTAIARWFQERHEDFPPMLARAYEKVLELPYGENPHQRAAYYAQVGARRHILSMVSQLGGKELSFNNILDLDAARSLLEEFQVPACVIVKHNNPCGVALGSDLLQAYQRAFASDPMSAFGGIVCVNGRVDRGLAEALVGQFIEVLFAPGYDDDALDVLSSKPNMRVLDDREQRVLSEPEADLRQVAGGLLVRRPACRSGAGRGIGLRRLLSLRGRATARAGRRRERDHPAGRVGARLFGHRSGQQRRRRDDLHEPPPLQTLTAGSEGGARDAIKRLGGDPASPYEGRFGFSRVVRLGSIVLVGGTTAIDEDGVVRGETPYEQTVIVLEKIGQELARAGATLADVIQTRVYVTDISRAKEVGRAPGEALAEVRPLMTMVEVSALIDPRMLVEIEAVAVAGAR